MSTGVTTTSLPNTQDLLDKAKAYVDEKLQNLDVGGGDSEELDKLKAQVNDLDAK